MSFKPTYIKNSLQIKFKKKTRKQQHKLGGRGRKSNVQPSFLDETCWTRHFYAFRKGCQLLVIEMSGKFEKKNWKKCDIRPNVKEKIGLLETLRMALPLLDVKQQLDYIFIPSLFIC